MSSSKTLNPAKMCFQHVSATRQINEVLHRKNSKLEYVLAESELPQTNAADRNTKVDANLFSTHGLEHFLQLDTELLNVVEDDTGL